MRDAGIEQIGVHQLSEHALASSAGELSGGERNYIFVKGHGGQLR